MNIEIERKGFEAWAVANGHDITRRHGDGEYFYHSTRLAFRSWLARAEIEAAAEACDEEKVDANATGDESDIAYNSALDHVKASILALRKCGADVEQLAKKLYADHTDNDPIVHCNRFPSWEELGNKAKDEWKHKAILALRKGVV